MRFGSGKRLFVGVAVAVAAWVALPAPALAFGLKCPSVLGARLCLGARQSEPDRSRTSTTEPRTSYNVDPRQYDQRWTSMFGSEFSVSKQIALFADYQYDQWAPSSPSGERPLRAWENYRVTVGCSISY